MNTTSTIAPSSAPGPSVPPPPLSVATTGPGRFNALGRSTPARMRLLAAVTAVLAVLLALFGWVAISRRDQALDRSGSAAARLVAVQEIRSAVIEADSIATTTFLVGGLEEAGQRAQYETRLADAAGGLALLFEGQSDSERDQLTAASATLTQFSGLVEQARANNRQGFPVGAAYQRQASELVRSQLLVSLDQLERSARDDVNDNIASAHRIGWVLPLVGIITLAAIVAGGWWLYGRTRRLVNVPLALGALVTVVVVGYGLVSMGDAVSAADDVVNGDLLVADQFSQARVGAFEARSDEALTLINRGNGAANEAGYLQAESRVRAVLDTRRQDDLSEEFDDYAELHVELRAFDDSGDWDSARNLLLEDSADAFATFSNDLEAEVQDNAASAQTDLDDAGSGLGATRWIVLIGALAAAALVVTGYGQRLKEYR